MGIKGLFPYIQEVAPESIKDSELKRLTGYSVAIDASAWMYQFLSVVRTGVGAEHLQNAEGEATSHLQGFLMRSVKLLEAGVHPVFVFDGKPPDMKMAVNRARREVRAAAAEEHAAAVASETASAEQVFKAASRSTVVTREHNESAKMLLRSMGIPVVDAPGEAEAACAQLCQAGKVYASVTEDMDVLTFGSPRQLKNLFDVEGARTRQGSRPARDIDLARVLEGLGCDMNGFIEFCILSGCDYLPHLAKIGAKTAFQLLAREGSLQAVVEAIRAGKGPKGCSMPDAWDWPAAKELFLRGASELPDVDSLDLTLGQPDPGILRNLLVEKYQFSVSRVDSALDRLRRTRGFGGPAHQRRIESFFRPAPQHRGSLIASPKVQPKRKHGEDEQVGTPDRSKIFRPAPQPGSLIASPQARPKREDVDERQDEAADSSRQQHMMPEGSSSVPGMKVSGAELVEAARCDTSPWACSRCTFANAPELPYCEMCEAERTGSNWTTASSGANSPNTAASTSPPGAEAPAAFRQLRASTVAGACLIDLDE
mmetsp:Transcript_3720/g.9582  ORF Transcript_3720/g.9582 Transcript_3720/m.9582 type:complete len:540 (+) Transcript_3720:167-1786(+)